ncbi:MAG: hypothetical protein JSS35_09380, partial [Proteobacteria bacterium]|nr:hypothetical protein [Pseudomonadota bacterium]
DTDGKPALQANVHYWRADGWYAGLFATQVDFKDPGRTSYELDGYGGRNLEFGGGRTELKLQLMYSAYPDNRTFGPTYDFLTGEVALKRQWSRKLTTATLLAFTPEGSYRSGKVWRVESEADYALTPAVTLKAQAGDQWGGRDHDRVYWSLGAATRRKNLSFELRYVDNDRTRANCPFLPKTCDPAVVATVTAYLPSLMF